VPKTNRVLAQFFPSSTVPWLNFLLLINTLAHYPDDQIPEEHHSSTSGRVAEIESRVGKWAEGGNIHSGLRPYSLFALNPVHSTSTCDPCPWYMDRGLPQ
jgi:hypothetical protein